MPHIRVPHSSLNDNDGANKYAAVTNQPTVAHAQTYLITNGAVKVTLEQQQKLHLQTGRCAMFGCGRRTGTATGYPLQQIGHVPLQWLWMMMFRH